MSPAHLLPPTLSLLKAATLVADVIPLICQEDLTLQFNVSCVCE